MNGRSHEAFNEKAADPKPEFNLNCPLPSSGHQNITLAHGGGGKLTNRLIEEVFASAFRSPLLDEKHDGAVFTEGGAKFAFTTDSYVVRPLFFPGGDIGSMAVYGTVNDLAMCGARPLYLSAGFILEEGLSMETLRRVVQSMKAAADRAGIRLVTGDTKVVDKGKGDGIFINTSGIGTVGHNFKIGPAGVKPGDKVLVSGDLGRHGIAVMAVREGLSFETAVESDCAPLWTAVEKLLNAGIEPHCLRDLTRGGLASALNEIAETRGAGIRIAEKEVPVLEEVRGACEILGLDPFYTANEGRFIAFVSAVQAEAALKVMKSQDPSAALIGEVVEDDSALVTMTTLIGTSRIMDMLSGEQLPRIC